MSDMCYAVNRTTAEKEKKQRHVHICISSIYHYTTKIQTDDGRARGATTPDPDERRLALP